MVLKNLPAQFEGVNLWPKPKPQSGILAQCKDHNTVRHFAQ